MSSSQDSNRCAQMSLFFIAIIFFVLNFLFSPVQQRLIEEGNISPDQKNDAT